MAKDGEIIVYEAAEIMRSLPSEMQEDDEIMDSVIVSLQSGVSKLTARQDALEIAQLKMQEAMSHGFNLVNGEIQGIKHSAEKDRIHASYAQKAAEQAKAIAEQAWLKTQEVAIGVAKAEAKADGARDLAKMANKRDGFDPITMTICSMGIVIMLGVLISAVRIERSEPVKQGETGSVIKCGVDVNCTYNNNPSAPSRSYIRPTNGGV